MKAVEWSDDRIRTEVPNAKRITGTRFASILGLDRWSSPFKTWCAITRTYEEPFVDNKYTVAGKTIEPKVIDYLNKVYFFGALNSPTDIYGPDYFKKTWAISSQRTRSSAACGMQCSLNTVRSST